MLLNRGRDFRSEIGCGGGDRRFYQSRIISARERDLNHGLRRRRRRHPVVDVRNARGDRLDHVGPCGSGGSHQLSERDRVDAGGSHAKDAVVVDQEAVAKPSGRGRQASGQVFGSGCVRQIEPWRRRRRRATVRRHEWFDRRRRGVRIRGGGRRR